MDPKAYETQIMDEPILKPEPVAPPPKPQSFFSRLIGVYFSPGETFQEIGRAPRVLIPILVLALFTVAAVVIASQRIPFDQVAMQKIDDDVAEGKLTAEEGEQRKDATKKIMVIIKPLIPVIAAITVIVMVLILAGLAKLISSMMGIENTFKQVLSVTAYAFLAVSIVSGVVGTALLFLKPVEEIDPQNPVNSNVAALLTMAGVKDLPKFVKGLLSFVDVFYIWRVALLGIGYAAVSRNLKSSTAMTYVGVGAVLIAVISAAWGAFFG